MSKNDLARKWIEKHPDLPHRTLAKIMYSKHKATFKDVEQCRSALRRGTGNCGKTARDHNQNTHPRPAGKAGMTYQMPASKSKKWEKFKHPGRCVLLLSDLHVPYHDVAAIEAAVAFAKREHKLDSVLLNGDAADCHSVSRWERAPDETDLRGELNAVREFLLWLHYELELPITYKKGNHEEWLDKFWWHKAPEFWGMPHSRLDNLLKINDDMEPIEEIKQITFIGEGRPIMVGKLAVFHGHELPKGLTNAVNPARGAYLRMSDTVVIGHHHRSSSHVEYDWQKKPTNCWSTGCMCDLTPAYARINKWNHGFAVVEVDDHGGFSVYNYKLIDNYEVVTA